MSHTVPQPPPLLSLRGVTKRFGGVVALDRVDFDLHAGEIHALLGENGAGKSTLIKVLGGIVRPDAGTIELDGRPAEVRDAAGADRLGIRLIHQELSLAPNLSVAENILLGREPTRLGVLVDRRRLDAAAAALVAELDMPEIGPVRALVGSLSVARQQLVEIARALAVRRGSSSWTSRPRHCRSTRPRRCWPGSAGCERRAWVSFISRTGSRRSAGWPTGSPSCATGGTSAPTTRETSGPTSWSG